MPVDETQTGGELKGRRVLVVDDDPSVRKMLVAALEHWGARATPASSGEGALEAASAERFDLALVDLKMPGMDGIEVLRRLKRADPQIDAIVATAFGTIDTAVRAMQLGAADYVTKPFDLNEMRLRLERLAAARCLREETSVLYRQVRSGFDLGGRGRIVGSSPAMQQVYSNIVKVASNRSNVFVQGETGTGKELVAKAIHMSGPRSEKPFVALNCGSMTKSLLESQLFGHVKGAFTNAVRDNPGFFVAAEGGTLFLDEITEVDTEIQAKLLRALQEREVVPVGGTRPVRVDVRIIAATNRDVAKAMADGSLRQDLYYRLSVVEMRLPPLRERREDIRELASWFSSRLSQEYGLAPRRFSAGAWEILEQYAWPGNVRQLENVIERAYALDDGPEVLPHHLPPEIARPPDGGEAGPATQEVACPESASACAEAAPGGALLERSEEALIRRTLPASGWNKSVAARRLGVSRKRLYRMMKKYGVAEPEAAGVAGEGSGQCA